MPGNFEPFNAYRDVEKTRRRLPHWWQSAATYFVTFRLADSLPRDVQLALKERKLLGAPADDLTWADQFLDAGAGSCLLALSENRAIVESALRYFDDGRYSLGAFAVMPNHVHVLVQPIDTPLTAILHSWKSFTASRMHQQGPREHVWQRESFDRLVRDGAELQTFHDYILQNPAAAKLRKGFSVGTGNAKWFKQT